jgi:hypothetical protein
MFGIFKKKAPVPLVQLSDAELDLIQGGGYIPRELDAAQASDQESMTFGAGEAFSAAALVIPGGRSSR